MIAGWMACRERQSPAVASATPSTTASAAPVRAGARWRSDERCSPLLLAPRATGDEGTFHNAEWSGDGRRFVTASTNAADTGTFRVWDAARLTVLQTRKVTSDSHGFGSTRKARASFEANDQMLSLAVPEGAEPFIWHLKDDKLVHLESELSMTGTEVSPDGRHALLASAWGSQALFDAHTGVLGAAVHPGRGSSTMSYMEIWVPGGDVLITSDAVRNVYLWELGTMAVKTLSRDANATTPIGLADVAITHDGELLVIAHGSATVELWSIPKRKRVRTLAAGRWDVNGDSAPPHGIALSPDGRWLLVQFADGSTRMWSLPDAKKSFEISGPTLKPEENFSLIYGWAKFSADGAYFSTHKWTDPGALQNTLATIYEFAEPPREVMRVATGNDNHGGLVGFRSWRKSGHLFERFTEAGVRQEWDPKTNRAIRTLPGKYDEAPVSLRFELNGDFVATRVADGERFTFRELPSGALLVVDDGGCIGGAIEEGRTQLRGPDGNAPSMTAVKAAHRTHIAEASTPSPPVPSVR